MSPFHDVRFPVAVGLGARIAPERATEIVSLASGREERNARWAHARRRYDAGPGVRSLSDVAAVLAFFEARRGRLVGFRFADPVDQVSGAPGTDPAPGDQHLGTGDGTRTVFQLVKSYGGPPEPYVRPIAKPVAGSVRVAVAGIERAEGTAFDLDAGTGRITFRAGHVPAAGAAVTAGFRFDVPVRFDTDVLSIDLTAFRAGDIPSVPLIEIVA